MEDQILQKEKVGSCSIFNNTGGPRSRVRSEPIKESFLTDKENAEEMGCYYIDLPEDIDDIELWLLNLSERIGWHGWQEIDTNIILPREKLIVFPVQENNIQMDVSVEGIIKAAILLSMSNQYCYLPDGPRIFTRSRLNRNIMLLKINIDKFYELE